MSQSLFEDSVLGSCLLDSVSLGWCHRHVEPEDFTSKVNRQIFELMDSMYTTGKPVDLVTIQGNMKPSMLKAVDLGKLIKTVESVQNVGTIEHYADLMRKGSIAWRLEKQYEKLKIDPDDEEVQKEVKRLWDARGGRIGTAKTMTQAIASYKTAIESRIKRTYFRVLTGYEALDGLIGGFYGGNLIVVGARTSVGKTAILLNWAYRFIRQKVKVLFISAEMSTDEMMDRLVGITMDIRGTDLRRGFIPQKELARIDGKLDEWKELPIVWIEGGKMSLTRMRTAIQTYSPDVVFVDFIQRFTPSNPSQNRAAYFSDLVNEMKALSMERKLVCFVASQLSRDFSRDDAKDPLLYLKESGGLEEASDIAIILKPLGENDFKEENRDIEFLVLKNRHGATGKVLFTFKKPYTQFFETEAAREQVDFLRNGKDKAAGS